MRLPRWLYAGLLTFLGLISGQDDPQCKTQADVVFLLDASGSIGIAHFQQMLQFVVNITDDFQVGTDDMQFGAVTFSQKATIQFDLNRYKSNSELEMAILNIPYDNGGTSTYVGLKLIREESFTPARGSRPDVPHIVIVVTDGQSDNMTKTAEEAAMLRDARVDIIAVGIGKTIKVAEVNIIASNPGNVFLVDKFEDLQTIQKKVSKRTCPTTPRPSTTTAEPRQPTNYDQICLESQSIGGVGHVPYPGEDCSKVLQCYYNPHTNKTLVVTRQCPFGQFWDQSCLKCVSSLKVDCPYDTCKILSELDTYPMEGVCGGYWACNQDRSYPRCCPRFQRYTPEQRCRPALTCTDKCPPEDICADGLGWCEKLPVWKNEATYEVASSSLGLNPIKCSQSNFSIVECRCQIDTAEIFMDKDAVCRPYYISNTKLTCSLNTTQIRVKQESDSSGFALKIRLTVDEPKFEILSIPTPIALCDHKTRLRIWADNKGLHAQVGRGGESSGPTATVLFKGWDGELNITVILHKETLRLSVVKDSYQFVAAVKAPLVKMCTDCVHDLSLISDSNVKCSLKQIQLYSCKPELRDIYQKI